jgi:hypothetical protein
MEGDARADMLLASEVIERCALSEDYLVRPSASYRLLRVARWLRKKAEGMPCQENSATTTSHAVQLALPTSGK